MDAISYRGNDHSVISLILGYTLGLVLGYHAVHFRHCIPEAELEIEIWRVGGGVSKLL